MHPLTPWCLLVFGLLGSRCNSLLSHLFSRLPLIFLPLVFYSILGDYTCVLVRPVSILLPCFLWLLFSDPQCLDEKPLKKKYCINVHCIPSPSCSSPPSFPPFFICDNSSLPCTVEQVVSLFMHSFFFCKRLSFLSLLSPVGLSVVY